MIILICSYCDPFLALATVGVLCEVHIVTPHNFSADACDLSLGDGMFERLQGQWLSLLGGFSRFSKPSNKTGTTVVRPLAFHLIHFYWTILMLYAYSLTELLTALFNKPHVS
jgi:hypothetical protein